jgi:mRNA interferase MazF
MSTVIFLKRGDIVLAPFRYTDQVRFKVRPALVVSGWIFNTQNKGVILSAITTNLHWPRSISYSLKNWEHAGLLKPSMVTALVNTIDPKIIICKIGRLSMNDLKKMEKIFKTALSLK